MAPSAAAPEPAAAAPADGIAGDALGHPVLGIAGFHVINRIVSTVEHLMSLAFVIGLALAPAIAAFAACSGFVRDRAFYPTVLIVVASYYVLFAAVGGTVETVLAEGAVMLVFGAAAVGGLRVTPWLAAIGLAAHGIFDVAHARLIVNPGVPTWWPAFCAAYDIGAGACLAWSLTRRHALSLSVLRRVAMLAMIATAAIGATGCGHALMLVGAGARRPAASEFGLGPRASAQGLYIATLVPDGQLRPRRLQTLRVAVTDHRGEALEAATLTVDGGMPQHRHGLPTRPRVTRAFGDGTYGIDGVRFSMGGWWEFRVTITGRAGADVVTFNLEL